MSQIEITVLKQGTISRNVLTCCIFSTGDAYRNFKEYTSSFKHFLKQLKSVPTFEIRIYTDNTGQDFVLEQVGETANITVLHYNCPQFREGNGHVGMFGTLVRFLPMFEELDTVWCSDIDVPDRYFDIKQYNMLVRNKTDFLLSTYSCYEQKVWAQKHTILAGRFISRIQFPRALLTLFLNRVNDGKFADKIKEINDGNLKKSPSVFPYGMDEYFLNTYIYNWLKVHNSSILLQKDYLDSRSIFLHGTTQEKKLLMEYYYRPNYQRFAKIKYILLKYLPLMFAMHPCYQDEFDSISKMKKGFISVSQITGAQL